MAQAIADAVMAIEMGILGWLLWKSYRRTRSSYAGFFTLVCVTIAIYRAIALVFVDYLKIPWLAVMHSHWVYDIIWMPTVAIIIVLLSAPRYQKRLEYKPKSGDKQKAA